jgi:hypothetical protein
MSVQIFWWGGCRWRPHICRVPVPAAGWLPAQAVSSVAYLWIDYLKSMTLQGAQFLFCFD